MDDITLLGVMNILYGVLVGLYGFLWFAVEYYLTEDRTCENCGHSHDEEGLLVCWLDDRVKDDDMTCDKWIQQRE